VTMNHCLTYLEAQSETQLDTTHLHLSTMADNIELSVLSWNVRGLSDPCRKIRVKNWINTLTHPIDILMLQELKADEFRLNISLSYIFPNYNQIVAYPNDGCGGTAILVHPRLKIISSGAITRGLVWVSIEIAQEIVHFASIYAPNTYIERKALWYAIANSAPKGKWVISGDFNMVESQSDSTSNSPVMNGDKLEEWRLLKMKLALKDAAEIKDITGPKFTRRGTIEEYLVQSRLDRFYFSDWTNW
jgi:exonuclease III